MRRIHRFSLEYAQLDVVVIENVGTADDVTLTTRNRFCFAVSAKLNGEFSTRTVQLASAYFRYRLSFKSLFCGLGARSAAVHCIHGGPRSCSPEAQFNGTCVRRRHTDVSALQS